MKNIYLVRHGESEGNVDRSVHLTKADHALTLSDAGHAQAQAAGVALCALLAGQEAEALRVWTSPYQRTRQTARHIQDAMASKFSRMDVREHINLCEQQFGLFDGVPDDELPVKFPSEHRHYALAEAHEGRFWARMPLGESRFDVAVRVHEAFGTFHRDAERHGVKNIVVVCHGVSLRAFVMQWRHHPYEWFDAQANPHNCDIYRLSDTAGDAYVYQNGRLIDSIDRS